MASEKKYQADAVIIGGGIAGITTALELLEYDKSVILLDRDRRKNFGGQAVTAFGGMLLVDTPEQKRCKIADSAELFLSDWLRYSELTERDVFPRKWAELYCHTCRSEVYEWVREKGIKFLPQVVWVERGLYTPGNTLPRYHVTWGTGYALTRRLIDRMIHHANKNRLQLCFGHYVRHLDRSGSRINACSGVIEATGEPFRATGDAIVIATGGIGGDLERIRKNWPADLGDPPERLFIGTHPYCNGELHDQTLAAGGAVTNLQHLWNYPGGIAHPKPRFAEHGLSVIPFRSALWMDYRGRRIGPQPLVGYYDNRFLWHRICQQRKKYSWLILNRKIGLKELAISGAEHNPAIRDRDILGLIRAILFGQKDLLEEMINDSKDFVTATSAEELAARMNSLTGSEDVDPGILSIDIAEYDAQIDRGPAFYADDQLRRIAQFRNFRGDKLRTCKFQKIVDPKALPLIAIRMHILIRKSLGGIQTDLESRVMNVQGEPVPGLYAVGEAAGFGGGGSNGRRSLEGLFISNCILTGRMAARSIVGIRPG
jgi:uncharacterized protein